MHPTGNNLRRRGCRLWNALRCRLGRSQRLRAIIQALRPACGSLAEFGKVTDGQFTALAKNLGPLSEQFGVMKSQLQVLDDVLNDRDPAHAVGSARALCKNSIELAHASLGVAHTVREHMVKVDEGLRRACTMREDFDKCFLMLRTVAMGFRVEAARVDAEFQGVFANVAAAISDVDRRIVAGTQGAFSEIEKLLAESAKERDETGSGDVSALAGAQSAIDVVRHDLDVLQAALLPCAQATARIAAEVERSGPLVLAVLSALQSQDIVRQRLEHVSDGLSDIGRAAGRVTGRECRELAYFGHAARIQNQQLKSARDEISRSGTEVTGGLEALLHLGSEILSQLNKLEAMTTEAIGSGRMSAMFSREIGHLARVAEACERASRRVAALVERIGAVIAVFTEEIEKQVREVELVALNAQVAAARLPCAGALEKLAEETTRISRANSGVSKELVASLRGTLDFLKSIRAESDEFLVAVASEKTVIERGAVEIGTSLHHHGEEVRRISAGLRHQYDAVQQRLGETLKSVDFAAQIEGCFLPVEDLCRQLEAEAGGDLLASVPVDARLQAHAARYTMEKERDMHRAAASGRQAETGDGSASPAPAAVPATVAAGGDIELF